MAPKINNVTNTDIEMLVRSGYDLCTYAFTYSERIGKGQCEIFDQPLLKATSLLATSRALADLAARILNQASNYDQADTYAKQLKERDAQSKSA